MALVLAWSAPHVGTMVVILYSLCHCFSRCSSEAYIVFRIQHFTGDANVVLLCRAEVGDGAQMSKVEIVDGGLIVYNPGT
ncbi:hypothetical protein BJY52DRAFT_1292558 [Lactarius psammicola]|nr:hypothetical protein BJY52DRAFT_1292558 [Lactarius psammicola]